MKTVTFDETKWKLVPIVPTNEMTSTMADTIDDPENERSSWDLAENVYRSGIAAAPHFSLIE